jgi:hypothetical protein
MDHFFHSVILDGVQTTIIETGAVAKIIALLGNPHGDLSNNAGSVLTHLAYHGD